jgi:hypothetical protein
MKTLLFSFLLLVSASFTFAQAPCPTGIGPGTNMGAGDCKECAGTPNTSNFDFSQAATAKVVLEFNETLPCIPRLLSITNEAGVTLIADCGVGQIKQGGGANKTLVEYCFWGDDEFFKAKAYVSATIKYDECTGIQRTCFLDGTENIPLPVHFKSFNANRTTSSNVSISWTTASEQNNKGFNVQKNVGGEWKTIAFVFSQTEDGNSTSDLTYSFKDANQEKGITQYRIQQVDLDGNAKYSDIRAIRSEGTAAKIVVYPNPSADGKLNIVFEGNNELRDVQVNDMQGRLVKSYRAITNNILVIERLTSGFYTIKITNRSTAASSVEKVVVK